MPDDILVEVVHARPHRQCIKTVRLAEGASLGEAIEASGIRSEFEDLVVEPERLGIFGEKATLDQVLRNGDRVEIYRPLIADPKEARRKRAQKQ
ncbi:MAG: RnfH family protein [Xanthomonadales bacterium]|nr:RnfH family protein [Gammaproteobacteria bacterium]NNE05428.1 RnfH family protein [Xanthomonadales bacterium]NNL95631.1 RnfH family protein [Xanthomonadales bacterium]